MSILSIIISNEIKLLPLFFQSELTSILKQLDERIHLKTNKKSSPNAKKSKGREHRDSFSSSTSSSNM